MFFGASPFASAPPAINPNYVASASSSMSSTRRIAVEDPVEYKAPLTRRDALQPALTPAPLSMMAGTCACTLCHAPLSNAPAVITKRCNHSFHAKCLETHLTNHKGCCPSCSRNIPHAMAKSPSGQMTVRIQGSRTCPGFFPRATLLEITYVIPDGVQLEYHESPRTPYTGFSNRTAYLPNNKEGHRLLLRLKYAFSIGCTFSVGRSRTSGKSNQVIWSGIPHKTSLGGGPFGFPDPSYIPQCNQVLDQWGIPDPVTCEDLLIEALGASSSSNDSSMDFVKKISYQAPPTLSAGSAILNALESIQPPNTASQNSDDCPICLHELWKDGPWVKIRKCQHAFHKNCIQECLNREPKCPNCRHPVGEPQGRGPSGSMDVTVDFQQSCPGFSDSNGVIVIEYSIPSGTQASYMEHPGHTYWGTTRTAYLPNNPEGRKVVVRLQYAFSHGFIFQVGTSLTTGKPNVVTWTSIHHKTYLTAGPHGYPDSSYLSNVHDSLTAVGIPSAENILGNNGDK